jgi:iron complex outermembrane receptor protein
MRSNQLTFAIAGILAASQVAAESAATTTEPTILDDVVVEGAPTPLPTFLSAPPQEIKHGLPTDAADLLRGLPGVSGSRMGGRGIDPIIRGQSQSRLNILLDGAYLHGGCPNRMDPPTLYAPLDSYDEITIIRGSQTVRYGAGGSGGSVILSRNTPRFSDGETWRGTLSGGLTSNAQTKQAVADIAAGTRQGFVRLTGHTKEADNYADGNGDTVRSAYKTHGINSLVGWTPADDQRLELGYEASRERDTLYAGAAMDAPKSDNDTVRLRYAQGRLPGAFANLKAELYRSEVTHQMDNFSLRQQTSPRKMRVDSTSDTSGGRISAELDAANATWTIGADYQENTRNAVRNWDYMAADPSVLQSIMWPDAELQQPGLFIEFELPMGAADNLSAGLRYDRVKASIDGDKAAIVPPGDLPWQRSASQLYQQYYGVSEHDATEDNLGGFLRYEHPLDNGWNLSASLSRSVRTADANERYLAASNMAPSLRWIGNPGLAPEKHHQAELGLSGGGSAWTLAGSLFYNRVDDYILRDRAHGQEGILQTDGATIYRNVEARLWGGEIEAGIRWGGPWSSRAVLSYVQAQNHDDDRPIAQTPPLEGSFSLDYEVNRWSAGALLRWAAKQTRVDTDPASGSGLDAQATPAWAAFDLYAQVQLHANSQLKAGIDNLFDTTYAYHVNRANSDPFNPDPVQVNEPGREFWVRLALDF